MGTAFSSKPPVLPWAKINWQIKTHNEHTKAIAWKKSPFGLRSLLRDWVLECSQSGSTTKLFPQPCPALQIVTREHLFWSTAPGNHQLPGRLLWCCSGCLLTTISSRATWAQVPDRNEPRYKHWSHLQRAKWSLKYHVSFIPIVLQKSKFVYLYVPCIHYIPTYFYRTVTQIIPLTESWHKSLNYYLEQPKYFVFWRK